MADNRYPLQMVHPHAKKSQPQAERGTDPSSGKGYVDYRGTPDQFPDVVINNETQEAQHRAKGYVAKGEPFPQADEYREFPKWMQHKTHEAVLVNDKGQQSEAEAKGYYEPGVPDAEAVEADRASPYVPGRKNLEYPRMENGILVQDPDAPSDGPIEYPKALTPPGGGDQVFVNSKAEERAMFAKWGVPEVKAKEVGVSDKGKPDRSAAMKAAWAKKKAAKAVQAST